jgi:homopolymeric O-antigen transport system permease protein
MMLRYRNPNVTIDPESRQLTATFELENRSSEPCHAGQLHLGWQLFNPETGIFITEGEWTPLDADLEAGAARQQTLVLELPPVKGHYHVYISPLEADGGWVYANGGQFLLVDTAVENQQAALISHRATTLSGLNRHRRLRSIGKAFTYPLRTIAENQSLIRSMVGRDIAARYRGSMGDALWTVLNPLLLMLTYFFVFGIVLQARFGGDPSRAGFALYFLAGMLPWLPFSEAVGRAPIVVLEHGNFVKKLVFPIEILPVNLTIAGLVTQAFALGVFAVFLLVSRGGVPITALWLPVLIIPQLLLTVGVSWFLAALGVYFRDLGQIIGYLLTLWFFLTPICYPEASLPSSAVGILEKNPMFILVRGFRDCLLEGQAPAFGPLWKLWLASILIFVLGHAWFYKLRKSFADVI